MMAQQTLKQLFAAANNSKGAADTSLNLASASTATSGGKADGAADARAGTARVHEAL